VLFESENWSVVISDDLVTEFDVVYLDMMLLIGRLMRTLRN